MDQQVSDDYSLDQAERFSWSSLGRLNSERVALLERELPGGSILDLGCGPGAWSTWMLEHGHHVVSLDAQSVFLAQASGLPCRVVGSAQSIPLRTGCIDTVVCMDVLEHVDDAVLAVREMARVARRRLVLTVPRDDDALDQFNLTFLHWQDRTHRRAYTEESLAATLRAAGLERFRISPELRVPWDNFLREYAGPSRSLPVSLLRFWFSLVDRVVKPFSPSEHEARSERRLRRFLGGLLSLPDLPSGLVAIVDLPDSPR
jgi:ubiquinone/menaquinone biosynthesis C-methylase UbiE